MAENNRLFLIDTPSHIYRAFFALPAFSTSKGLPTNAIYGFTKMLAKLIQEKSPDYLAAAFDLPAPTFRHNLYADYKANRDVMPENLAIQISHIRNVIDTFNIPVLEKAGYEADDVLATVAERASQKGYKVVIVSGDKDLAQLVNENITILDTMKDVEYDREEVIKKYGASPENIVDLFALIGDASDNVPGVPGIGKKTAVDFINRFGSIDKIYKNLDSLPARHRVSLETNREQALLSQRLIQLDRQTPLDFEIEKFSFQPPEEEKLYDLYKKFEFTSLLKSVSAQNKGEIVKNDYYLITDKEGFSDLISNLRSQKIFALDIETTDANPMKAEIVGISFSWKEGVSFYVPVRHQNIEKQLNPGYVLAELKPILEDSNIKKTGHNIKYEYVLFKRNSIVLEGIECDTMIASYVLNPSKYRHSLENLAMDFLELQINSYQDITGKGKKAVSFDLVPIETAKNYACTDSDVTLKLSNIIIQKIKEEKAEDLFTDIEMPLVQVLADMEMTGVRVDRDILEGLSREFGEKLRLIEEEIYKICGYKFNINSPKQLGEVLFEKLKLPLQKKTKTGYATDIETLKELSKYHPLPSEVLSYRTLAKLKSTYIDNVPGLVNPETGRIHTSYNQTVTATGRLSSSEPNLQNIPIRTEEGKRIREAFTSSNGWKLLAADYSQIELRVLAHLSEDENLIKAFQNDEDIHAQTASTIWELPEDGITSQIRRNAKAINFGIIYGISSFGLSRELGIDQKTAKRYIDNYFQKYKGVKKYLDNALKSARDLGYVSTLMGRRRYLPEINSSNNTVRGFAERTAVNAPVQGTAADLIKIAMIELYKEIKSRDFKAKMLMQVHDELIFEVPEEEVNSLRELVKNKMEGVFELKVPLKVDISWGSNWREAH